MVVVVNGEPITALDVESAHEVHPAVDPEAGGAPDVINELIDEKLKIKEGKRWGMELTDAEVDCHVR